VPSAVNNHAEKVAWYNTNTCAYMYLPRQVYTTSLNTEFNEFYWNITVSN